MMTHIQTTDGVKISVIVRFRFDKSQVDLCLYHFDYTIQVENNNTFNIQLVGREWFIFDSLHAHQIISGKGILGKEPVINAKESFSYTSSCKIASEIGTMKGCYAVVNLNNGNCFSVEIPKFNLTCPTRFN